MAALTADVNLQHYGTPTKVEIPAQGADTFYKGALVYSDTASGRCQAVPAAGDKFLGVVAKQTVATAQDDLIPVYVDGVFGMNIGGGDATFIGDLAVMDINVAATDNHVDLDLADSITPAAGDPAVGQIVSFHGGLSWVRLIQGLNWKATDNCFTRIANT